MKNRVLVLLLIAMLSGVFAIAVSAQDAESIAYGDVIEGVLTTDGATFTFEGQADDIVIARVREAERFSDFSYPYLTIVDAGGNTIATSSDFPYKSAELAVRLNSDGVYTLTLSSAPDNTPEDTVGAYVLELIQPYELQEDESVTATVDSQTTAFYLVSTNRTPNFEIDYERTNGTYFPPITISIVDNSTSELLHAYATSGRFAELNVFFLGDSNFNRYVIAVGEVGRRSTAGAAATESATFTIELDDNDD